jgi:dienelactone hydrolase
VKRRNVWSAAAAATLTVGIGLTPTLAATPGGHRTPQQYASAVVAHYAAGLPAADLGPAMGIDKQCFAAGDNHIDPGAKPGGVPTNQAWFTRDAINQYCGTLRVRDQLESPAYGVGNLSLGAQLWLQQLQQQLGDLPGHVHGGITTLVPGSQAADAFRGLSRWEQLTGGRVRPVTFTSSDGAQLRGHVFLPPKSEPRPRDGYPGIVITDGSVQAYEDLYYWAAEGLAQYGYEVMTYDVQGQGDSDLFPATCSPTSCPGVPYQQNYNFYQGAEDSLNFFDSDKNPAFRQLDPHRLGIAGHSLGAAAVSWVGQCDRRVKTIVAWDDLDPIDIKQCPQNVTVPERYRASKLHAPALATTQDYEFNIQPQPTVPNPHGGVNGGGGSGDAGYLSLAKAGVDSQIVSFRNGTHLTYSYIPLVLPANQLGERFSFYYTLAWFDRYLRGTADPYTAKSAYARLTSLHRYDASPDRNRNGVVSIGTGTWSPTTAAAHPTDPTAGNTPYRVSGIPIKNSLSFYYYSEYRLTEPTSGKVRTCTDMLAGCPASQPAVP